MPPQDGRLGTIPAGMFAKYSHSGTIRLVQLQTNAHRAARFGDQYG